MKKKNPLVLAVLAICFSSAIFAQEHQPSAATATERPENHGDASAKNAAKADEAESDGLHEAEQGMKMSASVKWLGKMLGISDPKTAYQVFWMLNFLVIASAVGVVLKARMPGFFQGRTATIQKGIEEARKVSAEASARLAVIEARLANLDSEIVSIRRQAEEEGKADELRLRAATDEEKRKILESAELEIATATSVARRELKDYAAELAVALAEKRITVSESVDRALVKNFTQRLGNGSGGAS